MTTEQPHALCLFCGAADEPGHPCDGRQGAREATTGATLPPGRIGPARFNGPAYDPHFDRARLTGQIARIWTAMSDRHWRTLAEIERVTGDPPASISAQLRHLRKDRFGAHTIERRARGDRAAGLWEYRLIPNAHDQAAAS